MTGTSLDMQVISYTALLRLFLSRGRHGLLRGVVVVDLAIHFKMTLLSMLEAYPATASALKIVCLLPLHLHHQAC